MFRSLLISLLILPVLTVSAQQSDNAMKTPLDRKVDSLVRAAFSRNRCVGLVVGVIDGDKTYTYAYGETVLGNHQLPDANTLFQIGSLTKTFTGILLAAQIGSGRVKAGDPISSYVPDSVKLNWFEGKPVTMAMLSNHTSAIPRWEPVAKYPGFTVVQPYAHFGDAQLYHFLNHYVPTEAPGEKYAYSNIGAGLLGELLARNAGTTYPALLKKTILRPLRMNDTHVTESPEVTRKMAQGYNFGRKTEQPWVMSALTGAGGIQSTLNDMLKYARANINLPSGALGDAIRLSQQETFKDKSARMGLGWHIIVGNGHTVLNHGGQTGGYNSHISIEAEGKKAVIVLSNLAADSQIGWPLQAYLMKQNTGK
ncbi:serine hydrolase [Chitinophaga sp.]|uniref:serine hydrolase domain-containing protein n=1 Tax=Chitinophaga sp. TaxID=1869181 RepID=UPI002624DF9C|nr:serine hydrolase domain-containing protein [uncultured Chitinophaga sp.]